MSSKQTTPARVGRERTCAQCGARYRSPRSTSKYCSPACRKKANRGTAPTGGPKAGPASFTVIGKIMLKVGYIGPVRHSQGGKPASRYALLVDADMAFREIAALYDVRGWGILTRDEFNEALKADGIPRRYPA